MIKKENDIIKKNKGKTKKERKEQKGMAAPRKSKPCLTGHCEAEPDASFSLCCRGVS